MTELPKEEYLTRLREEATEASARTLDALLKTGKLTEDQAIDAIVLVLDALLPAQALIPGPLGIALESADGVIFRHALEALSSSLQAGIMPWGQTSSASQELKRRQEARLARRKEIKKAILAKTTSIG